MADALHESPEKNCTYLGEEEPQNVKKKEHRGVYLLLLGLVLAGIAIGFILRS